MAWGVRPPEFSVRVSALDGWLSSYSPVLVLCSTLEVQYLRYQQRLGWGNAFVRVSEPHVARRYYRCPPPLPPDASPVRLGPASHGTRDLPAQPCRRRVERRTKHRLLLGCMRVDTTPEIRTDERAAGAPDRSATGRADDGSMAGRQVIWPMARGWLQLRLRLMATNSRHSRPQPPTYSPLPPQSQLVTALASFSMSRRPPRLHPIIRRAEAMR